MWNLDLGYLDVSWVTNGIWCEYLPEFPTDLRPYAYRFHRRPTKNIFSLSSFRTYEQGEVAGTCSVQEKTSFRTYETATKSPKRTTFRFNESQLLKWRKRCRFFPIFHSFLYPPNLTKVLGRLWQLDRYHWYNYKIQFQSGPLWSKTVLDQVHTWTLETRWEPSGPSPPTNHQKGNTQKGW